MSLNFTYFTFDDIDSRDYGIYIQKVVRQRPERDVEIIDVPGRSGAYVIDNGRFKNTTIKYTCWCIDNYIENFHAFMSRIQSKIGYQLLFDNSHNNSILWTRGIYTGPMTPNEIIGYKGGTFELEFNVIPQMYESDLSYTWTSGTMSSISPKRDTDVLSFDAHAFEAQPDWTIQILTPGQGKSGSVKIYLDTDDATPFSSSEYISISVPTVTASQTVWQARIRCEQNKITCDNCSCSYHGEEYLPVFEAGKEYHLNVERNGFDTTMKVKIVVAPHFYTI